MLIVTFSALFLAVVFAVLRWNALAPSSAAVYRGTQLQGEAAPSFRLIDHRGQAIALDDFRGKVVVLTFLDTQCTDVCPLVGLALRGVHEQLAQEDPGRAARVAFLAVNVSRDALRPEDAAAWSARNGMEALPTWHFLTGTEEELAAVWKAYGIAPSPSDHVEHTSVTYVIDQDGRLRWLSTETWPGPLSEMLSAQVRQLLRR
jgi:cytochrome oxidase Cu insertion factor (SCO1/SenC/PrrC family)